MYRLRDEVNAYRSTNFRGNNIVITENDKAQGRQSVPIIRHFS